MPGLNIDLSVKYKQILKAFQTEIQTVALIYEKNKHDPEILRNISPVAGRIGWARQLFRRIETPMMAFSKMSGILKVSYAVISILLFDFDSTAVPKAFDCLSKVIKVTETHGDRWPVIATVTLTFLFI